MNTKFLMLTLLSIPIFSTICMDDGDYLTDQITSLAKYKAITALRGQQNINRWLNAPIDKEALQADLDRELAQLEQQFNTQLNPEKPVLKKRKKDQ